MLDQISYGRPNVYDRHVQQRVREFVAREAEMHERLAEELEGPDRAAMIALAKAFRRVGELGRGAGVTRAD